MAQKIIAQKIVQKMPQKNVRLRLEAGCGSAGREYRVNNGKVEVRSVRSRSQFTPEVDWHHSNWHRLTPRQLCIHIERDTIVARWLELRLGWRGLLQACASEEMHNWKTTEDLVDIHAA